MEGANRALLFHVRPPFLQHAITEDVRKYAAEQKLSEEQALYAGLEQTTREFVGSDPEIYSKA
jgi:phosphomethylpyrimidine synthase